MNYTVRPAEIAKQYDLALSYVYRLASIHKWRRIKLGRAIHYDVIQVAETLQEKE